MMVQKPQHGAKIARWINELRKPMLFYSAIASTVTVTGHLLCVLGVLFFAPQQTANNNCMVSTDCTLLAFHCLLSLLEQMLSSEHQYTIQRFSLFTDLLFVSSHAFSPNTTLYLILQSFPLQYSHHFGKSFSVMYKFTTFYFCFETK